MKRKPILIGLSLFIAGALVFALGFFGGGMDVSAVNGDVGPLSVRFGGAPGDHTEKEYSLFSDGITYIELVESNTGVVVSTSPDGRIHLICQESADDAMEIENNSGKLTMKRRGRVGFFFFWFPGPYTPTELQLPEGLAAEVVVRSFNAGVTAEGLTLRGDAEFSSGNGSVAARDLDAAKLTLRSSNGTLTAERIRCEDASLINSNGSVTASDFACASLEAKSANGKITLADVSGDTICAGTSNSTVEVDNVAAGTSIELRSSNGAIRGTLAGSSDDYSIESKTSNGSNNLPPSWGKGEILLTAKTSNGSIDLRFTED